MQKQRSFIARALALAMSTAMVTTMLSTAVFAEEEAVSTTGTVGVVQSFDKLPERFTPSVGENAPAHVYALSVGLGTPAEDLQLPEGLSAMVERTPEGAVVDSGAATATKETVWVTWQSDKEYKSDENGKFVYTAVLQEGFTLARGVQLPQIYVMVGRQARLSGIAQRTTQLAIDQDTATTDNLSTEGWKWDKATKTLTLNNANFSVSGSSAIVLRVAANIVLEGTNTISSTTGEALLAIGAVTIDMATGSNTTMTSNSNTINSVAGMTVQGDGKLSAVTSSSSANSAIECSSNPVVIKGKSIVHAESTTATASAFTTDSLTIEENAVFTAKVPSNASMVGTIYASLTGNEKVITCNIGGATGYTSTAFYYYGQFYEGTSGSVPAKDIKIANGEANFDTLTANGIANTTSTTELTLTFDKGIAGLAAADITVTGATKGRLTKGSGTGVYKLTISNITVAEGANVNVAVAKTGYTFTPTNRDVAVHKGGAPIDVSLITVGGANATAGYETADVATLKKAIESVANNGTVKLGADISGGNLSASFSSSKTMTLDLNGKSLALDGTAAGEAALRLSDLNLTIKDSAPGTTNKLSAVGGENKSGLLCAQNCSLTVESGTIETTTGAITNAIISPAALSCYATLNIKGGNITATGTSAGNVSGSKTVGISAYTCIISGGTVTAAGSEYGLTSAGGTTFSGGTTVIKGNAKAAFTLGTFTFNNTIAKHKTEAGYTGTVTVATVDGQSCLVKDTGTTPATDVQITYVASSGGGSTDEPSQPKDPLLPSKSGGGGSGGKGSGTGLAGALKSVTGKTINTTEGSKNASNVVRDAIQNALATGTNAVSARASFRNFTSLAADGLKTINSIAAKEAAGKKVDFKINFDQVAGGMVTSRISVNPAELAKVMGKTLPLGVYFNQQKDKQVTEAHKAFAKQYSNKAVIVSFEQKTPLGVNADFAAQLDLSGLNTKTLYFYSHDPVKNTYTYLPSPGYWKDSVGYSHLTAPLGGSIIIVDAPLAEK